MSRLAQKDLASMLGISQTTVSAVLNNNPAIKVSETTRQRILETAAKANYWPNRLANSLRARKTKMIAVVHRPGVLQVGIRKYLTLSEQIEKAGYSPLLTALPPDDQGEEACRLLRDLHVDGVVLVGMNGTFLKQAFEPYLHGQVPVVAMDSEEDPRLVHFRSDRRQGFALLVEHLLSLGYHSFGVLAKEYSSDTPSYAHARSAIEGTSEAFAKARIRPSILRYRARMKSDRFDPYHGGRAGMEQLLQRKRRPRAVICSDDSWAIGALEACWNYGVRVPEEIAIVGFQNEVQGKYSYPALTSVDPPIEALAARAVEHLIAVIEGEPFTPATHYLPCQLVVRASCGAAAIPQPSPTPASR